MKDLEKFIQKFGNVTKEYKFYDGKVTLRYDVKNHVYYLVTPDGLGLERLESASGVGHIIDKSEALVPWSAKVMGMKLEKLLDPVFGQFDTATFEKQNLLDFIKEAKSAHKDHLDDAGNVGKVAHAWIEEYIKARIAQDPKKVQDLLANLPAEERAQNACIAALDWMNAHNVRWRSTERKIYSKQYKYAGTLDGLCEIDSCTNPKCCPDSFKDKLAVADWKTSNHLYIEYILQVSAYMWAYMEETNESVTERVIIRLGKEDGAFEPWHLSLDTFGTDFSAFLEALNLTRRIEKIKERMDLFLKNRNLVRKEQKLAAKEESLKLACKNSSKYKGKRKPTCNNGNPCQSCLNKYDEIHKEIHKKVTNVLTLIE